MTDDEKNIPDDPESEASASASGDSPADDSAAGDSAEADSTEELIEAEGPDVETSFTDEDLAFLNGEAAAEPDLAAERLLDLQRLQAEYVNYRKRVERDREANREIVIAEVLKSLLPALDDLSRAEAHGDLEEGPMSVIAQKLRAGLDKFGLTTVGAKGDVFDPHLHEALVQLPSADVTVNTVADVIEPGYLLGERLLRPAKVAVSVPGEK